MSIADDATAQGFLDLYQPGRFACRVTGERMKAIANAGDVMLFDPCPPDALRVGDFAFVRLRSGEQSVRRIVQMGKVWIIADYDGGNPRRVRESAILFTALPVLRVETIDRKAIAVEPAAPQAERRTA